MNEAQLRRLDLNLLMIFRAIARHRKFSAAADDLGITGSGVSHAVNRLREIFNDELFVRHPLGIRLTHRAKTLEAKIARIVELASDAMMLDESFDPGLDHRHLRLGTVEYSAMLFGPILAEIFQREAPHMRLSIATMRRAELIAQVDDYTVDLGIGSFFGGTGELDSEVIHTDRYVTVARKGNPLLAGGLTRELYLEAKHIVVMTEAQPPAILEAAFARQGITRKIALTMPLYVPALAAVGQTEYLLTVHEKMALRFAMQFGLEVYPLPIEPVVVAATLISHPSARNDPGLRWFRRKVEEAVARVFHQDR